MSQSRKRKTEFGKEIEDYYISKRNAFDVTYEEDLKLTLASSEEIFTITTGDRGTMNSK